MPRKKNPETIEKIIDASWLLFCSNGYDATSYSDIAAASQINKGTIQHYFPSKKCIAEAGMSRLLYSAQEIAAPYLHKNDTLIDLYVVGQIYLAALISCESSCRFFSDILENRALLNELIGRDFTWSLDYVNGAIHSSDSDIHHLEDMIVAMGGLYELMYFSIKNGVDFDIPKRLTPCICCMAKMQGKNSRQFAKQLSSADFDSAALQNLGCRAYEQAWQYAKMHN